MKKKIIYGIFIFIILVFLIPILINEFYLPNKGYLTVWNGADVLSFYGAVLAALGGIVGVFLQLNIHKNNIEKI